MVIPEVMFGTETWSINTYIRNICGIRRSDRVRNSVIRERGSCDLIVVKRVERNVLKGFEHVERMEEESKRNVI